MNEAIATTTAPDFIQLKLREFNVPDAAINEMAANFLTIKVSGPTDKVNAELARSRRLEVKRLRVNVEKSRVALKEDSLKFGRAVDTEAKRITALLTPIESHLQTQEEIVTKYQERLEAEARAKEEAERKAREQAAAEERAKLDAERAKLDEERRQFEAEKARIEAERQKQEEIRLAAERAAERAAFETEQRLKREADERAARELAEAAAKPDREKLLALAERIKALEMPAVEGFQAQMVMQAVKQKLAGIANYLEDGAQAL
jgi:hypothetical protein